MLLDEPLRVLHVVATGQRRGAEIFTADLVGALDQLQVAQRVAVLRDADGPAIRYGAPTTMLGADAWTLPGLRMGLTGLRMLRRTIDDWKPDVVQAHGGEALKYSILGQGRRRSPRVVYRRIGSTPEWIARGPRRSAYGRLMRRAARVVAVAETVREETLRVFRLPGSQVVTIPNAVDSRRLAATRDRAAARQALGIPAGAEVVLSLGALTWEKDPAVHVDIAAEVLAARPAAWHLIVGDGQLRGEVEAAVARRGTGERTRLLGARDDVPDLLEASDVLLFASCSEGMPATVIEAGIAGLPVAGYAVAGVAEVVESGVTGLLARPGDPRRLGAHVLALLADAGRRQAMGAAARERCRARFDIEAVAPRYLGLYRELKAAA
jgi:glycosyltransferase involved in cell wall biosynthesis